MTKESTQALSLSPPPEKELIVKAAEQVAHNLINYQDLDLGYTWSQTLNELEIYVPLSKPVKSRDLEINFTNQILKIGLKGEEPIVQGEFYSKIKPGQSTWSLETPELVVVSIEKLQKFNWWECVIIGHPKINVSNLTPDTYLLPQLYSSNREIVKAMMEDQRVRAKNKIVETVENNPEYAESLKRFLKLHPELIDE